LVAPEFRLVLVGEIVIVTAGGTTVTVALAFLVVSAALVTVTMTFVLLLTLGAVKRPELEMVPAVVVQVTALLLEPLTVAVNCKVAAELRLPLVGEIAIVTLLPGLFGSMVISGCALAVLPLASIALTQKYLVTADFGVPVTAPVTEFRAKPAGRVPSVTANLYGATPPVAAITPEYGTPTTPLGRFGERANATA
jgi:hypothetical protein